MFCYMRFLSTLLCLLLLHQNGSTASDCLPGQRRNYITNYCESCPDNQYNPKSGTRINCDVCSKCEQEKGSKINIECTLTQDTICKCKPGFKPVDEEREEFCVCRKGFGLEKEGEICTECKYGFFTDKDDSTCQRWKECKSGIATKGTNTADVVCKNATEESDRKMQQKTEAPKIYTTLFQTTTMSSAATSRTTTSSPSEKADGFYILWLVLLGAGFLLIVGILFSKCKVTHCIQNLRNGDSRKEGVCRKPVEESGEKCLSLLV